MTTKQFNQYDYFVVREDTDLANVFPRTDFDDEGNYDVYDGCCEFNILDEDIDVVLMTNDWDEANNMCDSINDKRYNYER